MLKTTIILGTLVLSGCSNISPLINSTTEPDAKANSTAVEIETESKEVAVPATYTVKTKENTKNTIAGIITVNFEVCFNSGKFSSCFMRL